MAIIPVDEKVFMVSNSTNTTYSGSASLKAMNEWYTMQDVSDSIQPYKVFTALLTQTGTGDELNKNSGLLIVGVTYKIDDNSGGLDMMNVGAPNNDMGTYFIATGTTPSSYGTGNLTYDPGAPVATVLENTIGNIWFTYDGAGTYNINSDGLLSIDKRQFYYGLLKSADNANGIIIESDGAAYNNNFIQIITLDNGENAANGMNNIPIEIRVYN
jgi:hypothetical protein